MSVSSNQKLKRANESQDEVAYGLNYKVLTSNCVDGVIGDVWRERLRIQKSWDYSEKSGILEDESYTYKKGDFVHLGPDSKHFSTTVSGCTSVVTHRGKFFYTDEN